jgi:branched-chain amino acid transport system substrate-binding protein
VTAKIAFDEKGDIKGGAVTIYQVRQGQWHAVQTMGGAATVAAH